MEYGGKMCSLSFPVLILSLQLAFSFPNHYPYQRNHMLKTFNISTSLSPSTSFSTPKHYHPQSTSHPLQEAFRSSSRRDPNLSVLALLITGSLQNLSNNISLAQELELDRYTDSKEGFTLRGPSSYVQVDKAGATVLFEEASKGSNNIGVVVTPVRLTSLGEFGSPQFVADKLIQAEKKKQLCFFFLYSKTTTGRNSLFFWNRKARRMPRLFLWLRDQAMEVSKCMNLNTRLTVLGEG
ncbi:PREDICTED: psbP domain-containing protein 2, chloroplastic-like isoform X2 [Populus euphratica]|uniref:PsbP domain-containing protein 2, chloroplastic-like isoform X2 n=1 Tax=Populus euphratica TaxID=75702 RepID=A0AAJ6UJG7_POPEU|nr:PREDICTED: psbP domain-containing protein 2, chloroplastic-like isoform X2 [Populus euphratica]